MTYSNAEVGCMLMWKMKPQSMTWAHTQPYAWWIFRKASFLKFVETFRINKTPKLKTSYNATAATERQLLRLKMFQSCSRGGAKLGTAVRKTWLLEEEVPGSPPPALLQLWRERGRAASECSGRQEDQDVAYKQLLMTYCQRLLWYRFIWTHFWKLCGFRSKFKHQIRHLASRWQ